MLALHCRNTTYEEPESLDDNNHRDAGSDFEDACTVVGDAAVDPRGDGKGSFATAGSCFGTFTQATTWTGLRDAGKDNVLLCPGFTEACAISSPVASTTATS